MRAVSTEGLRKTPADSSKTLPGYSCGKNSEKFIADEPGDPGSCNREIGINDINDHFSILRQSSMELYGFDARLQGWSQDDQLADNLNVIFDCFDLDDGSARAHGQTRLEQFNSLAKTQLTRWVTFLKGTPTEIFKLLVYRLNIDSISEMKCIFYPLQPDTSLASETNTFWHLCSKISNDQASSLCAYESITEELATIKSACLDFILSRKKGITPGEFGEFLLSSSGREILGYIRQIPGENLSFLAQSGRFNDLNDVHSYLTGDTTLLNLETCDLPRLANLAVLTGLASADKFKFVLDIISSTYHPSLERYVKDLTTDDVLSRAHARIHPLIQAALQDTDYGKQNLYAISTLLSRRRLKEEEEVIKLEELIKLFDGFVTPTLAEHVFDARDHAQQELILTQYRELQEQLLGSSPVKTDDISLVAEAIFLAYRPSGFDIPQIIEVISKGKVKDLSHHLKRIVVREQGYPMRLRRMIRHQTEEFDCEILARADELLMQPCRELPADSIISCLSPRKADLECRAITLASILQRLDDPRITAYQSAYRNEGDKQRSFDERRLESLHEILSVIPDEDLFSEQVASVIRASSINLAELNSHADTLRWKANKGRFTKEQKAEKNTLDILIRTLKSSGTPLNGESLKDFSEALIAPELRESLTHMDAPAAAEALSARRSEFYLDRTPDASGLSSGIQAVSEALREEARKFVALIKREKKKISSSASDQYDEVTAYISKNVGSFFAKAGAKICTAWNFAMWEEERHYHLNIAYEGQIIWNNMLYFESSEELSPHLIARGINPREDTMLIYDRRSMTREITRVLDVIAADNNKRHTYITAQTGFHALSNRDGVAHEMTALSNRAQRAIKSIDPSVPPVIQSRSFSYMRMPLDSDNKNEAVPLIILTSSLLNSSSRHEKQDSD